MNPEIARRPVAQRLREWLIARCLAPINLDGSQVSEVTIDGDSVSEVTMDGDQVFGAIPDSGDLYARYDPRDISLADGDAVSNQPDETGNGRDLTQTTSADQPTYQTGVINGNAIVRYDGSSEFMDIDISDQSTPNHVFAVVQYTSTPNDFDIWFGGGDPGGSSSEDWLGTDGSDNWALNGASGERIVAGAADTNAHIWSGFFNPSGNNSTLRIDGTQVASGDIAQAALQSITIGADSTRANFANVDQGEILVYPTDKTSIESDVEDYLSDEWGITI